MHVTRRAQGPIYLAAAWVARACWRTQNQEIGRGVKEQPPATWRSRASVPAVAVDRHCDGPRTRPSQLRGCQIVPEGLCGARIIECRTVGHASWGRSAGGGADLRRSPAEVKTVRCDPESDFKAMHVRSSNSERSKVVINKECTCPRPRPRLHSPAPSHRPRHSQSSPRPHGLWSRLLDIDGGGERRGKRERWMQRGAREGPIRARCSNYHRWSAVQVVSSARGLALLGSDCSC